MNHRSAIKTALFVAVATAISLSAHAAGPGANAAGSRANLSTLQADGHYSRFIVTYREGSTERKDRSALLQNVSAAASRSGLDRAKANASGRMQAGVQVSYKRKLAIGADLVSTSRSLDRAEAAAFMQQIAADPAVLDVSPDVLLQRDPGMTLPTQSVPASFTPNDPFYRNYQWHLKQPSGTLTFFGDANFGGASVNDAWDISDGDGIVIAVLDTGITRHVDVDTSLADAGYDFISDAFVSGRATDERAPGGWDLGDWTAANVCSADSPAEASSWHGTHVASTAGAELTNNGLGMSGVAFGARILPVRVLGHCGGFTSDIADAIVWAAGGSVDGVPANAHPADVINLSLGGSGRCTGNDPTLQAVRRAINLGTVVVVSAGNSNDDASHYTPASCPGVITVAATGITSKRAYYSNYGSSVEIAAPGGGVFQDDDPSTGIVSYDGFVWQALNNGTTTPVPVGTTYGGFAGTSQAAPHVSGTVALMQSARKMLRMPLLRPNQVLHILEQTAERPVVQPGRHYSIGAGILDANAAVEAAVGGPGYQGQGK